MEIDYVPYCYLIGWSRHNTYYYGVEYGNKVKVANPNNICNPSSLYPYFTSSPEVDIFFERFGIPNIVQVRRTFKTKEEALNWEKKVLRRLNVKEDPRFLNKSNGFGGKGTKNLNRKTPHKKHEKVECPHCNLIGGISIMKQYHFINCKFNPVNNGVSPAKQNKPKMVCPHCDKEGSFDLMERWHLENCKSHPNNIGKERPKKKRGPNKNPAWNKGLKMNPEQRNCPHCNYVGNPGNHAKHMRKCKAF